FERASGPLALPAFPTRRSSDLLEGAPDVPARVECVVGTERCTTLGNEEATVSTVEHLLAAARGLEVDNLLIEIDGPEVPIGDGRDRKSTRLNSSHVKISYAVFC